MFVHDFTYVAAPVETCRERLLSYPLDDSGQAAYAEAEELVTRVGPAGELPGIAKTVTISLDAAYQRGDVTVVPLHWRSSGASWLFPELMADLELAPMGTDATQLSLLGRYEPPMGAAGRTIDKLLLHRVAEATIRSFLRHLAGALQVRPSHAEVVSVLP